MVTGQFLSEFNEFKSIGALDVLQGADGAQRVQRLGNSPELGRPDAARIAATLRASSYSRRGEVDSVADEMKKVMVGLTADEARNWSQVAQLFEEVARTWNAVRTGSVVSASGYLRRAKDLTSVTRVHGDAALFARLIEREMAALEQASKSDA